jgi:hypothetical protein
LPLRQSSFPPTWFRCSVTSHPELFTTAAWTDTIDTDDGIEEKDAVSDSVFATVDDGNPDEDLFDSMVQAINDNVKAILEKHQQLISSNTNESTQSRTIQERWLTVFEREKRMLRRTMRNNHPKTTSCDELWSKALVAMHQHEPFSPPTSSQERFDFDDEVLTAQLYHSPIFGLAMNDQFGIDDMDACVVNHVNKEPLQDVLDDREEEEDLTMQLQELESLVGKSLNDDMRQQRLYHEAMLRSIALLSVMDVKDWRRIECRDLTTDNEGEETDGSESADEDEGKKSAQYVELNLSETGAVNRFLEEPSEEQRQYTLSTLQGNLMLAHLVASVDADSNTLANECVQIYREMKLLGECGQTLCQPDATTYRILLLALNQRFIAPAEAINLSQSVLKDETIDVTPPLFLEAMKACHLKMDLNTARSLMGEIFADKRFKPSLGSYMLFFDMLKANDLRTEALEFIRRVHQTQLLSREAEDKLLVSVCRWPRTTRQGNFVDLSSFLLDIVAMLHEMVMHDIKPGMSVWMSLINYMNVAARRDPSLWNDIATAMRTVLDLYPLSILSQKLATTGLNASIFNEDPRLAAAILDRVSQNNHQTRPSVSKTRDSDLPLIPFAVIKSSMDMCLRLSDIASAETIINCINDLGDQYPKGAIQELYSLLLLCHAKLGDPEKAYCDLKYMIEEGMKPGEHLYGAVLQSLVLAGQQDEAELLVESMESQKNGIDVVPGTYCYDALLMGRIRRHDWDGAIGIYDTMKAKCIVVGPQTIQGLVLAHQQRGGDAAVVLAVEAVLQNDKARIQEGVFRLIARILLKEMDLKSFDSFRQQVRAAGEKNSSLRDLSLQLVRSLRVAEIETGRPSSKHKAEAEMNKIQGQAWKDSTAHLLDFFRAVSKQEGALEGR